MSKGVPRADILEAGGDDSYENIGRCRTRAARRTRPPVVLVTTDPFHEDRSMAIAADQGLTPSPTPTQTSPITGWADRALLLEGGGGRRASDGSSGTTTWSGCTTLSPVRVTAWSRWSVVEVRGRRWCAGCRKVILDDGALAVGVADADDAGVVAVRAAVAVPDDPGLDAELDGERAVAAEPDGLGLGHVAMGGVGREGSCGPGRRRCTRRRTRSGACPA